MDMIPKGRKVATWHLVGLTIALALAASHLAVWNIENGIWTCFLAGAVCAGAIALFVGFMGG